MRSMPSAFLYASSLEMFSCCRIHSVSCLPIFMTGFKLVIGSWKIMEILLPRIFRFSSSLIWAMSLPSNKISPSAIFPVVPVRSPMMDNEVTLLPLPDSPTIPRVDPSFNSKSTPSTERTTPLSV